MLDLNMHPALLIIDMQNGFCHPSGTFAKLGLPIDNMRAVIPTIARLRTAFRAHALPVIYTRMGWADNYSDSGILLTALPALKELKGFVRGTWDADIVQELAPFGEDVVVDKTRYSVFRCPSSGIEKLIAERGIDHLVVVGVGTNVCVESTVRDAFDRGISVVTVSDVTATLTDEAWRASLASLAWFGGVTTVEELEEALRKVAGGIS